MYDTSERDKEVDQNLLVGEWRRTDDSRDEVMTLWRGDEYNGGKVTRSDGHVIGSGELEWHTRYEPEIGRLMVYMYFFDDEDDDGGETCVIDENFHYEYDRNTDPLVGIGINKEGYERIY